MIELAGCLISRIEARVRLSDRAVDLDPAELTILSELASHPNEVVSFEWLLERLHRQAKPGHQFVLARVSALREKLGPAAPSIVSVRGVGYRLDAGGEVPEPLRFGDLRIAVAAHRVWLGERELRLSPLEFGMLAELAQRPRQPVPKRELAAKLWRERKTQADDLSVVALASSLRRKLGVYARIIVSVPMGYMLDPPTTSGQLRVFGDLTVDPVARRVLIQNRDVELTHVQFELLDALTEQPGIVLTRAELMARAWGSENVLLERAVTVNIHRLRAKLDEYGSWIVAVPGEGYLFKRR